MATLLGDEESTTAKAFCQSIKIKLIFKHASPADNELLVTVSSFK